MNLQYLNIIKNTNFQIPSTISMKIRNNKIQKFQKLNINQWISTRNKKTKTIITLIEII
jgi:hypothetical protein